MSLAERQRISLRFESAETVISCYVDHDKFSKIMSNLLSNAFKFTPKGGVIIVSIEKTEHQKVKLRVQDNGIGIAKQQQCKIFDRFYQSPEAKTSGHMGTGIGLAFAKEMVEFHRGSITVESESGVGSTFIVQLPLGISHLHEQEIVRHSVSECIFEPETSESESLEELPLEIKGIDKSKPLVLIVEDNKDVRLYIRDFLAPYFFLKEAIDGEQGFQVAADKIPDLIISDVMMPKMDGLQLCKKLKLDERTSHIPIILLTARASEQSKLKGLEQGADDYIAKPFSAKELLIRSKNLILQRQKLRDRFRKEISLEPKDIAITSADERFLGRAMAILEEHFDNPEFTAAIFAQRIGSSRMQLHRKLYALTGQSTSEFIRIFRLKKAAQMLKANSGTIGEIAYSVGFRNASHFSTRFRELFDVKPSEYPSMKNDS